MAPVLQLVGARFSNFLLRKLSRQFIVPECRYSKKFKWPYFGSVRCYSHIVGHAGSTIGTVHADMTLTRSKVKVKVMGLLNLQKLAKLCMLAAMTAARLRGFLVYIN